ncbi:MAG TPA: hypothetical protein VEI47_10770 [Gemmatimonadales bacterium]|nr:hypothetical protein [Gemmatimonadales bacterium]
MSLLNLPMHRVILGAAAVLAIPVLGCGGDGSPPSGPGNQVQIVKQSGDAQTGPLGGTAQPYRVKVTDENGFGKPGVAVSWTIVCGAGAISADTSVTDASGVASITATLPAAAGAQSVTASVAGASGSPVLFTSRASAPGAFAVSGGGNNVPERYSSDLWVAGGYAYTGTWNWYQRTSGVLGQVKIFQLGTGGAPTLIDSVSLANVVTVSDLQVSPDGQWLVVTAEGGSAEGLYVYSLADPAHPAQQAFYGVGTGLHTGSLSVIGGKLYAFTAKNPGSPALMIFDLSDLANGNITLASSTPIPPNYGIHDTFIRDGICFAFVWNEGVYIYDVGKGVAGGSPQAPVQLGSVKTSGGEAHNGWWFWNPVTGEKRYLFVGQEGPGAVGSSSSGDIHVVDVSDLTAPKEVGTYHMQGAGTHNFWMDEARQRLYAAYYNGGVVALDVSCDLAGDLGFREIARIQPGGSGQTYTWGVMLSGSSLYAIDMLSGLWQLAVP